MKRKGFRAFLVAATALIVIIAFTPRLFGCLDDFDILRLDDEVERQEARVLVMDEVSTLLFSIVKEHGEVPGLLLHPAGVRSGSHARDMDAPCLEVDEEQDIEGDKTPESPYFLGEEVRSPHDFHLGLNEFLP